MSPVSQQGSPPCRVFEQEWADACLALRGRSNPHTSTRLCCQHPRDQNRTVEPGGEGAGAVGWGRQRGEQDANQKGRAERFQDANHVPAHPAVSTVIWFCSCTFILPPSPHQRTPKSKLCPGFTAQLCTRRCGRGSPSSSTFEQKCDFFSLFGPCPSEKQQSWLSSCLRICGVCKMGKTSLGRVQSHSNWC